MKCVSSNEMQALDQRTIKEAAISGQVLMERAGKAVALQVAELCDDRDLADPLIHFVAGRGNNGGDAFAAAAELSDCDFAVEVLLAGEMADVKGDARAQLERCLEAEIPVYEFSTAADWAFLQSVEQTADVLVDGLLGTGTKAGPPREPISNAIEFLQQAREKALVLAIDIPSGLDPDTGAVAGQAVQADVTLTIGLPKKGLIAAGAIEYVGHLMVADIGFPNEFVQEIAGDAEKELIVQADVQGWLPRRRRAAHKGDFGHVLVIGGSRDYSGAVCLATLTCLRAGGGLVTAAVPESIADRVASFAPEIMVRGMAETEVGSLRADVWDTLRDQQDQYDAILIGPGLTRHAESTQLIEAVVKEAKCPLIIDADGLTAVDNPAELFGQSNVPIVLTPHPGEFAHLFGQSVEQVQAHRIASARTAAEQWQAVVVLKGGHTVIAAPGHRARVNPTGNPGIATGGSGDVLAGLCASLVGQGLTPFDAASAAVWCHGTAADVLARRYTEATVIASDLIKALSAAFHKVCLR